MSLGLTDGCSIACSLLCDRAGRRGEDEWEESDHAPGVVAAARSDVHLE